VPVGIQLSYQFQFHAVSLYSQPNLTPYSTAVLQCLSVYRYLINFSFKPSVYSQPNLTPYRTAVRQCLSVYSYLINFIFSPSVSIRSPIYHLTVQLSVSACMFTVISSISVSRRLSVYTAQSNTLPYGCPSVPVGVQLSYQFQFHAVSPYSDPNLTPYCTAVRLCLSVYSYLINFSFTVSVSIRSQF